MNRMSIYLNRKFDEINQSEWVVSATHSLENLHWYLKKNTKGFKLLFGNGRMRRKFIKITDLYSKDDMAGITCIKNKLIAKNSVSRPNYNKTNEIIYYCSFLEQFKSADYYTAVHLYESLIELLDLRHELGRLILKKATELNSAKQERRLLRWLGR